VFFDYCEISDSFTGLPFF